MVKYIIKRVLYMFVVLIILSVLMFVLYNLTPSNRAYTEARTEIQSPQYKNMPEEEREKAFSELYLTYQRKYGTDTDNMALRYFRWLGLAPYYNGELNGVLQGNFGYSYTLKDDVINVVKEPMKNTIFINVFATIIALAITIPWVLDVRSKKGSLEIRACRCSVSSATHCQRSLSRLFLYGFFVGCYLLSRQVEWKLPETTLRGGKSL